MPSADVQVELPIVTPAELVASSNAANGVHVMQYPGILNVLREYDGQTRRVVAARCILATPQLQRTIIKAVGACASSASEVATAEAAIPETVHELKACQAE